MDALFHPPRIQSPAGPFSPAKGEGMADKIDLNGADKDALDAIDELQGHGHEIVRYREERGGFTSLRQLEEVPGLTGKVSEATFDRLSV
jgi:DNA uptake protein ComE-like DNA-binding protein